MEKQINETEQSQETDPHMEGVPIIYLLPLSPKSPFFALFLWY